MAEFNGECRMRYYLAPPGSVFGPEQSLAGVTEPILARADAVEALEQGGKVGDLLEIEQGGHLFY